MSKKTLDAAKKSGNEAIIQVKKNQPTLYSDCQRIADTIEPDDVYQEPMHKARNRIESRTVSIYFYPLFTHFLRWGQVKMVVKVERYRSVFSTKKKQWIDSHETAFFISTIDLDAQTACQAIRHHWRVENCNHHVRDVTLGEDASRIRINPHIMAKLRSFALNIFRKNQINNISVATYDNVLNLNNLLNYVGIL